MAQARSPGATFTALLPSTSPMRVRRDPCGARRAGHAAERAGESPSWWSKMRQCSTRIAAMTGSMPSRAAGCSASSRRGRDPTTQRDDGSPPAAHGWDDVGRRRGRAGQRGSTREGARFTLLSCLGARRRGPSQTSDACVFAYIDGRSTGTERVAASFGVSTGALEKPDVRRGRKSSNTLVSCASLRRRAAGASRRSVFLASHHAQDRRTS